MRIRGVFFTTLESRAEAHIDVDIDAVAAAEAAVVEVRVPRAVRAALRRRPVVVREAIIVTAVYV